MHVWVNARLWNTGITKASKALDFFVQCLLAISILYLACKSTRAICVGCNCQLGHLSFCGHGTAIIVCLSPLQCDRRRTIELTHLENDGCIHNTHMLYQTDKSDGYKIFNIQFALAVVAFSNFKMALQQTEPLILPDTSPFCHRCWHCQRFTKICCAAEVLPTLPPLNISVPFSVDFAEYAVIHASYDTAWVDEVALFQAGMSSTGTSSSHSLITHKFTKCST